MTTFAKMVSLLVPVAALVVVGCGSDDDPGTTSASSGGGAAAAATVQVASNAFTPATVTIKKGQAVRWVWSSGTHDVVSGTSCSSDGKFTSGPPASGTSFERTFDEAGTFDYFCTPHCSMGMTGKVIVE